MADFAVVVVVVIVIGGRLYLISPLLHLLFPLQFAVVGDVRDDFRVVLESLNLHIVRNLRDFTF